MTGGVSLDPNILYSFESRLLDKRRVDHFAGIRGI